jgi:hypothetical protein
VSVVSAGVEVEKEVALPDVPIERPVLSSPVEVLVPPAPIGLEVTVRLLHPSTTVTKVSRNVRIAPVALMAPSYKNVIYIWVFYLIL